MVNPKNSSPLHLAEQTLPRVRAEDGLVKVRLELVSLADSACRQDVEIHLPVDIASTLGEELHRAVLKLG